MTHRQILRQLAEAGRLHLQDFDEAALVHLLRDELVTVAGQTVTLTEKGRRRVAPKKALVSDLWVICRVVEGRVRRG